jgi:predicted RND superfamily exporter protein
VSARSRSGERAVRWILDHRALVLATFGLTLCAALSVVVRTVADAGKLPIDNSLEIWFLEDDPALVRYRAYQEQWGNDEAVVIGVFDAQGVLRAPTLNLVAELAEAIRAEERVKGVTSLATVTPVREGEAGEVLIERYYQAPVSAADEAAVRARVLGDPLFRDHLVASDERATALIVQLEASRDFDRHRVATLAGIRRVVSETLAAHGRDPEADWAWGGIGVIHVALNTLVMNDTATFMVWTNVVLILGLGVAFRRLLAVVACVLSVGAATCLLIGVYLSTGLSLNMVTMVLPTLVMVVGLTDAVYFLMTFQQQRLRQPEQPPGEAVVEALGFCFWPGLFNSVTTAVGFLAFVQAPMAVVRHLGVFAGVGIGAAFLSSLTVCALLLARWPERVERPPGPRWTLPLDGLADWTVRHRRLLLAGALVVAAVAVGGILRIRVDSYSLAYFYDDHEIRSHDRALLDSIGPYLPLELVLRTGTPGGVREPALLQAQRALIDQVIEEEPTVARAISLAGVTERIHRVFSEDPSAALPSDPAAVEQELLFYDPERPDDPVVLVQAPGWEDTRFTFRIENKGALEGRLLLDRIHDRARPLLPDGVTLESGGYMPLYAKLIDHLVRSQVTSIVITTTVILLMIAGLFRSIRYALLSFLPNTLPVAATLGAMGYLGINLDVATVLVASVALGVAVDDTIHFLYKFRAALAESGDPEAAVRTTLTTTGRAIASTSLIVTLGFSVLCLASIKTVALFGLLLGVAMIAALVAEFVVTPAVLLTFPPRVDRP